MKDTIYKKIFSHAKNKWKFTEDTIQEAFLYYLENYPHETHEEYDTRNLIYKICYNLNKKTILYTARELNNINNYTYTLTNDNTQENEELDDLYINDIRIKQIIHFLDKEIDPIASYIFKEIICYNKKYTEVAKELTQLGIKMNRQTASKINNTTIEYIKTHFNPNVLEDIYHITKNYKYKKL